MLMQGAYIFRVVSPQAISNGERAFSPFEKNMLMTAKMTTQMTLMTNYTNTLFFKKKLISIGC